MSNQDEQTWGQVTLNHFGEIQIKWSRKDFIQGAGDRNGKSILCIEMCRLPVGHKESDGNTGVEYNRINSPAFDNNDEMQRRQVLRVMMENMTYEISRRLFPKDTLVFDTIDKEDGSKAYVNPHYPC